MTDETYLTLLRAIRLHSGLTLDEIREAGEHGADSGYSGFVYTTEAARFAEANIDAIWDALFDLADDLDQNPCQLVGSFNRADMTASYDGFLCLLSWFALEETGRRLADRTRS